MPEDLSLVDSGVRRSYGQSRGRVVYNSVVILFILFFSAQIQAALTFKKGASLHEHININQRRRACQDPQTQREVTQP